MNSANQNLRNSDATGGFEKFMKIRLFLGCNYNGGFSKAASLTLKLYSAFVIFLQFGCMFVFAPCDYKDPRFFMHIEYSSHVLLSLFVEEGYFVNFYYSLTKIDRILNFKHTIGFKQPFKILFITLLIRSVFSIVKYIETPLWYVLLLVILNAVIITNDFPKFMVFYTMNHRMKCLRKIFETKIFCSSSFFTIGTNDIKVAYLRKCLLVYNELLLNLQNNDLGLQIKFLVGIMVNFPKLILTMFNVVKYAVQGQLIAATYSVTIVISDIFVLALPAYYVERAVCEIERIKELLIHHSIESDEELRSEVEHTLECVSLRPFRYSVCRAVSVDGSLPIHFVRLCVTYVIVAVQFVKLKD